MAPVEVDSIPRDNVLVETAEVVDAKLANFKIVEKMFQLPLVNDAYSEVQKLAYSTGLDTRVASLSPMIENVVTSIKTSAEEIILPRIPGELTDTIQKNVTKAVNSLDSLACDGIDTITNKLPALKEPLPELIETSKLSVVTGAKNTAAYLASFPFSQVALKVVDLELDTVDNILKYVTGCDEKNLIIGGIEIMKYEAAVVRKAGVELAGTEKAKKIEESSLLEAIVEVVGVNFLISLLPSWIFCLLPQISGGGIPLVETVENSDTTVKDNVAGEDALGKIDVVEVVDVLESETEDATKDLEE